MSLLALTVSYRDVGLAELEEVAIPPASVAEALPRLVAAPDVLEALILSTCNRTEVYAWTLDADRATEQIRVCLEDLRGLPDGWARERIRVLAGDEAIRHLFMVTSGLDSMVRGESEIQGQVRAAYRTAASRGAVGPHLHGLLRWALEVGKKVRSETGLGRAADSLPGAAAKALGATLGALEGAKVLIVGSGKMAAASARALASEGARVMVAARRPEAVGAIRGCDPVTALPLDSIEETLASADGAIFATAAPEPLLDRDALSRVLERRDGHRLGIVDLGLPRNVDGVVSELEGGPHPVVLYDLERLDREGFTGPDGGEERVRRATELTMVEAERCIAWFRAKPADAIVAAIQDLASRVAAAETERAASKLADLGDQHRRAVEEAIRRGIRKIVHSPTVRTKEACSRGDLDILEAAKWLFSLEGEIEAHPDTGSMPPVEEVHGE